MFANEAVDVLGVVDTVADSALIQTRDGKDVSANIFIPHLLSALGDGLRIFRKEVGPGRSNGATPGLGCLLRGAAANAAAKSSEQALLCSCGSATW